MIELSIIRDLVAIFGVIAGFSYYVLTVRANQRNQELALKAQQLQLETRQAQLLMQVYNKFDTKEKHHAYTQIWNWQWNDFEDFWTRYGVTENLENWQILTSFLAFYEGLGTLVKTSKLPIEEVYLMLGGLTISVWGKFVPILDKIREQMNYPRFASETEWLYHELMKYQETQDN
jgi:hypothetical protein